VQAQEQEQARVQAQEQAQEASQHHMLGMPPNRCLLGSHMFHISSVVNSFILKAVVLFPIKKSLKLFYE
jgi:hypothetical protein